MLNALVTGPCFWFWACREMRAGRSCPIERGKHTGKGYQEANREIISLNTVHTLNPHSDGQAPPWSSQWKWSLLTHTFSRNLLLRTTPHALSTSRSCRCFSPLSPQQRYLVLHAHIMRLAPAAGKAHLVPRPSQAHFPTGNRK